MRLAQPVDGDPVGCRIAGRDAQERMHSRGQLEEKHAQRIDIGGGRDVGAAQLFGGVVSRQPQDTGSRHRAVGMAREAEIGQR